MVPSKYPIVITVLLILLLSSCEIEKIEYTRMLEGISFTGFQNGLFILYDQSISYYSPEVNKVYPGIYTYQNGKPLGNGIHSFYADRNGLISFQKDNKIEFIDLLNFISEGVLEIEKPRDIYRLYGYCLVSFGDKNTGGIAIVDLNEKRIEKTLHTGMEAGKIYRTENYLYVFSDGNLINDSIIEKFYYQRNTLSILHKLDSFNIGIRPVDFVEMTIHYDEYYHKGLAILCKGNSIIPASIVLFDLITEKVIRSFPFESTNIIPENLFWFPEEINGEKILASYVNNKIYSLSMSDPVEMSILINKNISNLFSTYEYYLAVSRDTLGSESYMYRFDLITLDLVDSLSIPTKALKLTGWGE